MQPLRCPRHRIFFSPPSLDHLDLVRSHQWEQLLQGCWSSRIFWAFVSAPKHVASSGGKLDWIYATWQFAFVFPSSGTDWICSTRWGKRRTTPDTVISHSAPFYMWKSIGCKSHICQCVCSPSRQIGCSLALGVRRD